MIVNLLEITLYHKSACVSADDCLVELADYCYRKIVILNSRYLLFSFSFSLLPTSLIIFLLIYMHIYLWCRKEDFLPKKHTTQELLKLTTEEVRKGIRRTRESDRD